MLAFCYGVVRDELARLLIPRAREYMDTKLPLFPGSLDRQGDYVVLRLPIWLSLWVQSTREDRHTPDSARTGRLGPWHLHT